MKYLVLIPTVVLVCSCETPTAQGPPTQTAPRQTEAKQTKFVGAMVGAIADPSYKIGRESKLYVFVKDSASIRDRKLGVEIERIAKECGLTLVDAAISEFALLFESKVEASESKSAVPHVVPDGRGGFVPTMIPTHHRFVIFSLSVAVYKTDELAAGKKRTAWEGRLVTESHDFDANGAKYLRSLVELVGKDGNATVLP